MLHLALDPAHPADVPIAIGSFVLAMGAYLIHCQRQHVRRKVAARRRVTSIR